MVAPDTRNRIGIACLIAACVLLTLSFTLLVIGGIAYPLSNRKVKTYAESNCLVYGRFYMTYQCTKRSRRFTCFGPAWDVYYGDKQTIPAVIETTLRRNNHLDALELANEFEVGF